MRAVIRTDASTEIGTGHVMRCVVLAEQLRKRNVEVLFLCRKLPGHLIDYLHEKKMKAISLPNRCGASENIVRWMEEYWKEDALETIAQMNQHASEFDIAIVDHYGIDASWEKMMKPHVKKLLVIDDLANRAHDCHLLLDQNLYKNKDTRYRHLLPPQTKQLLGLDYLLLREEFHLFQQMERNNEQVKRILISFGGSDATNETIKAVQAIESLHLKNVHLDVVIGYANPHTQQIYEYCKKLPDITLHDKVDYVAKLMAKADLAIGSGGSTTWERCYMQLPTITIETALNQAEILAHLADLGAVYHLGKHESVTEEEISRAVWTLLTNRNKRKKMVTTLQQMMDGFHVSQVVDHLIGG